MRHLFRSSLTIAALLATCLTVPVPAQAEPTEPKPTVLVESPEPRLDALTLISMVDSVSLEELTAVEARSNLAIEGAQRFDLSVNAAVPTLVDALRTPESDTGRAHREPPNRRDRRNLSS